MNLVICIYLDDIQAGRGRTSIIEWALNDIGVRRDIASLDDLPIERIDDIKTALTGRGIRVINDDVFAIEIDGLVVEAHFV